MAALDMKPEINAPENKPAVDPRLVKIYEMLKEIVGDGGSESKNIEIEISKE